MFRRWWFVGQMRPAQGAGAVRGKGLSREAQHLVIEEWEAAYERLQRISAERVAAVGDILREAELPVGEAELDAVVRRDYQWALDAFAAAGKVLDEAGDLPDLAAAAVLAERALERFAAVHARLAGAAHPPKPAERCYYNPLHAAAERPHRPERRSAKRRIRPRGAAADRRPGCASCRKAILAGQAPDVLPALIPVKVSRLRRVRVLVPYYSVPQKWSLWSLSACGAYGDEWPALVLRGEHRRRSVTSAPAGGARRA
ncbi:hypothetical protein [Streptomyces sp. NBC_01465]|uniref:hypothetical protein n=1 Tax=Streptomyces sp. NBC_01465 TaxID=2903878 RepID=UPI002E30FC0F|nr:hypothetical protein [Streptomyces sp. NBC_01465]